MLIVYGASISNQSLHIGAYLIFVSLAFILNFAFTAILGTINFFHLIETPHFLRNSILRLGQYPISIYKGATKLLLSFIVPVAFMFSVPAKALFGDVTITDYVAATLLVILFFTVSVWFWKLGLKNYKSAQG